MHLLGTLNDGSARNAWFMRRISASLEIWAWAGGTNTGEYGRATLPAAQVPADTWMAVAMTLDFATRTVKAGVRVAGAASWVWQTAVWPETFAPTATVHSLGARSPVTTADGFEGRIAGGLTFVGHDAHAEPELLDRINAWAFGDKSIFGL